MQIIICESASDKYLNLYEDIRRLLVKVIMMVARSTYNNKQIAVAPAGRFVTNMTSICVTTISLMVMADESIR